MKKLLFIIYFLITVLFLTSCGGHFFNPRYYYNRDSSSSGSAPDTEPEVPPEQVPENEDPFKNGDWNSPNYQFPADNFKNWLFKVSFQKNKLPIYTFFNDNEGRYWISGGKDWNDISAEYYNARDGENITGSSIGNVDITGLKVYRYVGNNPLYSSEGYLPGRMDRFNFYSINGKASLATLKQYLIAVDTYSKFIFAYGAITDTEYITIADEYVPTAFEAIEKHADKRPFFEYDPIGYVKEDGSVVLYEHYEKEFVKSPTTYEPKIHPEFTTMAKHTPNGQGNSPYFVLNTSTINPEDILDRLKNSMYGIRDKLVLYEYKFDATGNSLELTSNHYYDGSLGRETYTFSKVVGLTAVEYTNSSGKTITITGLDDFAKISDGTRTYILNYSDDGPEFRYRVAGKIYKDKNGSYEYRFNADGTSLDYYENGKSSGSYTFSQQDASDRAVYRETTAVYWGLRISDYDNIKDGVLYRTGSSWASPETTPTQNITSKPGYLNVNVVEGGFTENVKGKTYKYRDYSEYDISSPLPEDYKPTGKSLILYTYTFSTDGQTLDIKEETWNSTSVTKQYKVVSVQDKSAIYEYNGSQITLSIQTDNNTLYKDNIVVGTTSFTDYGPLFPDKVRNARFFREDKQSAALRDTRNVEYVFSADGSKITLTYEDKKVVWDDWTKVTCTYVLYRYDNDAKNNHHAVYKYEDSDGYVWVELSEDGNTIKSSANSSAIPSNPGGMGLSYEAYRQ